MSGRDRLRPFRLAAVTVRLVPFLAALLALPAAAPAAASDADPPDEPAGVPAAWADAGLSFRGTAVVSGIEPGGSGTLALADGRRLRLAGITLPRRPLPVPADQAWPIEAAADAALAALTSGRELRLYQAGRSQDRYGRLPIQAVLEDGRWLQAVLLRQGLARVEVTPGVRIPVAALLDAESEARRAGIGLWALPAYRVRRPGEAGAWIDSVQLVEGRVTGVYRGKDGLTLAFGGRRRNAFSVHLPFAVWTEWAGMPTLRRERERERERATSSSRPWAADPAALVGRRLRVRGWIGRGRNAEIEVGDAGQIEWIGPTRTTERRRRDRADRWADGK